MSVTWTYTFQILLFSNEVAELLYEIAHIHLSSSRRVTHRSRLGDGLSLRLRC